MAPGGGLSTSKAWMPIMISLLAAIALLLLAGWLDTNLQFQQKLAAASFEYQTLFRAQIGSRSLLLAAWFGLAWLVLLRLPKMYLTGAIYLILGGFILLSTYIGMLVGVPVTRLNWVAFAHDFPNFSGAFIAVLGLLILTKRAANRTRVDSEVALEG